ncbi:MAG TPA: flippase-like domain-containing protein [Candidatus Saccharimonadales bacterium]|nr:flippase-like domain-containing protein [Candidatus Saccharimonadales bacterium]
MAASNTVDKISNPQRRYWFLLIILAFGLYILLPQLSSFRDSLNLLTDADLSQLGLAVAATALTYFAAAGTYYFLAFKPLSYGRTLLVQPACMFINRLLPAGIGGLGANYVYLRKNKHSRTQAGSVVAANNLLGFVGHGLLATGLLAVFHNRLPALHALSDKKGTIIKVLVVLLLFSLVLAGRWRKTVVHTGRGMLRDLASYRHRLSSLFSGLTTSICLTLGNVLSFWFCSLALHHSIGLAATLVAFTLGIAIGTAVPTPGGLGGTEAGLVAGLVAYHLSAAQALAIVLTYRLISFWLAIIIGGGLFAYSRRRGYL